MPGSRRGPTKGRSRTNEVPIEKWRTSTSKDPRNTRKESEVVNLSEHVSDPKRHEHLWLEHNIAKVEMNPTPEISSTKKKGGTIRERSGDISFNSKNTKCPPKRQLGKHVNSKQLLLRETQEDQKRIVGHLSPLK